MKDPYSVLGVAKTATADEIKSAYRQLARELHPDVNPGDARAESRFKDVSAAYDFLSDADRRAQYDRGEIGADGTPRRRAAGGGGRAGAGGTGGSRAGGFGFGGFGGFGGGSAEDIFADLMRRKERGRAQAGGTKSRGADARHSLTVGFLDAATGTSARVTLVTGKALDVRIPPGTRDGQTLRLKGQGHPGVNGGEDGDALIDIVVAPHPHFSRRDQDVLLDLPVSLQEAVLGGKITVPTLDGRVALTVPPNSNTGTVLRLKGKGIAGGDLLVTLKVVLPDNDPDLRKFAEKWGARHGYDPRAKAGLT